MKISKMKIFYYTRQLDGAKNSFFNTFIKIGSTYKTPKTKDFVSFFFCDIPPIAIGLLVSFIL